MGQIGYILLGQAALIVVATVGYFVRLETRFVALRSTVGEMQKDLGELKSDIHTIKRLMLITESLKGEISRADLLSARAGGLT